MAHLNALLAAGARPVVGRIFEAGAACADDAVAAAPPAPELATTAPPSTPPPALPFVGAILAFAAGERISVARTLSLDNDLYLADHNFVHAPGVKPLAACFPVQPMTVSLEAMAQAAACLAPGYGLVGFDNVVARHWIALADGGALALRIEGRVVAIDAVAQQARIAVQIFTGDDKSPAIEATVRLASRHQAAPPTMPLQAGGTVHEASALYGERQLFHGPRFQGLCGQLQVGADGASAELVVRDAGDWFAGQRHPQLLTDAAALDTVGQLIALWAMPQGHAAFPIGLARLDLHCPTPAPGARLPIRLRVVGVDLKMLSAEIEIGDGNGGLWASIRGWKSWLFEWTPRLVRFQREPGRVLLSAEQALPAAPGAIACRRIGVDTVKHYDLTLLARHYLHASEWPAFVAKAAPAQRQREWLLGRVAVKDAARAWSGQAALHPATFAVVNDSAGQPALAHWPLDSAAPRISIAHAGGHAVGIAARHAVGIDLEAIAARDEHCVAALCTQAERALLAAMPDHERTVWITRLWCAKEAFGKRLGTGVTGGPQRFEARALDSDASLALRDTASGAEARVVTVRSGDWIIAADLGAAHPTLD